MQEVARGVYIETGMPGVTLGAILQPHGQVLIDAPPRPEDARSWRSTLINLSGGVERLLVNLDAHFDRTIGVRSMECTSVAHDKVAEIFRNRPTSFKAQPGETGAEWELIGGLTSLRWAPPEITFSRSMQIHWGDEAIWLEYHPGPNPGATWVSVPDLRVVFVGDTVTPNQPPFLAQADIPTWIGSLETLLAPPYNEYLIIGGRCGLIPIDYVRWQLEYLRRIEADVQTLAERKADTSTVANLIPGLLQGFDVPDQRREQYSQRLNWGLRNYYARRFRPSELTEE